MKGKNMFQFIKFLHIILYLTFVLNAAQIHQFAASGDISSVMSIIDKNPKIVFSKDDQYGAGPLSWAALNGQLKMIKYLLEKGANVNETNYGLSTPLELAASQGQTETIKFLLENGAKLDSKNNKNGTPLYVAIISGHLTAAEVLLNYGADVKIKGNKGFTALHLVCLYNMPSLIEKIISLGVDVNIKSDDGATSLHCAASLGNLQAVKLLLTFNANKNMEYLGLTASMGAKEQGFNQVAQFIDDYEQSKANGQTTINKVHSKCNHLIGFPCKSQVSYFDDNALQHMLTIHTCETSSMAFGLIHHDYPPNSIKQQSNIIIEAEIKSYLTSSNAILKEQKSFSQDKYSGIEIEYILNKDNSNIYGIRRFLLVDNTMYTYYGLSKQYDKVSINAIRSFLLSFKLR